MPIATLDAGLLASLQSAAREVLETMVSMSPTAIVESEDGSSRFKDEVVGLLGFTGTRTGTFVLRTTEQLAKAIAAQMLMMDPAEMADFSEAADGFGEVVNMVSGNFKNAWVANGSRMDLSVPNVIYKGEVKLNSDSDGSIRSGIVVKLPLGDLAIGVHIEPAA